MIEEELAIPLEGHVFDDASVYSAERKRELHDIKAEDALKIGKQAVQLEEQADGKRKALQEAKEEARFVKATAVEVAERKLELSRVSLSLREEALEKTAKVEELVKEASEAQVVAAATLADPAKSKEDEDVAQKAAQETKQKAERGAAEVESVTKKMNALREQEEAVAAEEAVANQALQKVKETTLLLRKEAKKISNEAREALERALTKHIESEKEDDELYHIAEKNEVVHKRMQEKLDAGRFQPQLALVKDAVRDLTDGVALSVHLEAEAKKDEEEEEKDDVMIRVDSSNISSDRFSDVLAERRGCRCQSGDARLGPQRNRRSRGTAPAIELG